MTKYSLPRLHYALTINPWCHIQTAWKCKFKCSSEEVREDNSRDDVEALQAGHSHATENQIYGLSVEALAGAVEDVLPFYLEASTSWQRQCNTFPGGSQFPYWQARSIHFTAMPATEAAMHNSSTSYVALPAVSAQDISRQVVDMLRPVLTTLVQDAISDALEGKLIPDTVTMNKGKGKAVEEEPSEETQGDRGEGSFALIDSDEQDLTEGPSHTKSSIADSTAPSITPISPTLDSACTSQGMEHKALSTMRGILQNSSTTWRSTEQREAMMAVLEHSSDVVAVLGTGAGKSMLAIVPSMMEEATATVLVLPLNSLIMDYEHHLTRMAVPYQLRSAPIGHQSHLVSADKAQSGSWQSALARLAQKKMIAHVVFDEAHIPIIAKDYHKTLNNIYQVCSLPMQLVLLSATLPPSFMPELATSYNLLQSTNRPEHIYLLEKITHT
ncbi:hypothetical protein PAXRUDRAFT_37055 [Paxillus rubicundulus Ve08.2h10]|uniref:Helicase ATP-binding domain-containing protein n=1 Tax=Paxillus rubicundulus Ve08.2h10 TaxID=930991 RepID=A0A0D0D2B2_9AGAM|nr:hypothetical protein PAXRUDRAFT_37055 [Paxillus rubicundulus Ve08.2h10]